jgi:hypothetical protein
MKYKYLSWFISPLFIGDLEFFGAIYRIALVEFLDVI